MRLLNTIKLLIKFKVSHVRQCVIFLFKMVKKNMESINSRVSETNNGTTMILSNCKTWAVKNKDLLKNEKQVGY